MDIAIFYKIEDKRVQNFTKLAIDNLHFFLFMGVVLLVKKQ